MKQKNSHFIQLESINSNQEGCFKYKDRLFHKSSFIKEWLDEYIPDVKTILDIGALDGGDSFRFSIFYPNAKIYTIEASPDNFSLIKSKLNTQENIKVFNFAISDKNQKMFFYQQKVNYEYANETAQEMIMGGIFDYNNSFKSIHNFFYQHDTVEVEGITLDKFCSDNNITSIDFAHIDVEGAGFELLNGMNNIMPKLIFIEKECQQFIKGKSTGNTELLHKFTEKGYTLLKELPNDFLFIRK